MPRSLLYGKGLRRPDCAARLRRLLAGVSDGLLASWLSRRLQDEGFTPGQVSHAKRTAQIIVEGRGSRERWRLKTVVEMDAERKAAEAAERAASAPQVAADEQPKRPSHAELRGIREEQRAHSLRPGALRKKVNSCDECALPIGTRAPGQARLCIWCERRQVEGIA